jgi:hypothetical protein
MREKTNSYFFEGFYKAALLNSLIGKMTGLKSGGFGVVSNDKPDTLKPGVVMAPKSTMPELPTSAKSTPERNLDPWLPPKMHQNLKT